MKLTEQTLKLIRKRFGTPLVRPSEFDALAEDIYQVTGERLGVNTLKRLFGTIDGGTPTATTLDIIAQYVGFQSFPLLEKSLADINSGFSTPNDTVYPQDLTVGTLIELTYEPHRRLLLEVQKDHRLKVVENENTKLLAGDLLTAYDIRLHIAFFAKDVERGGTSLSTYTGGIEGGVTSLRVY